MTILIELDIQVRTFCGDLRRGIRIIAVVNILLFAVSSNMQAGLTSFSNILLKFSLVLNGIIVAVCLGEEGSGSAISLCIYLYFFKKPHYNNIILNTLKC